MTPLQPGGEHVVGATTIKEDRNRRSAGQISLSNENSVGSCVETANVVIFFSLVIGLSDNGTAVSNTVSVLMVGADAEGSAKSRHLASRCSRMIFKVKAIW
ncbi:hypothetical protein KEM48_007469 [Puccinia striiformis f. sp. tritici PST-130]|uniref:Uncharacterized protein n=1 Tax=Puccinia striiformis f. sp. tritici PST-78 TaxID=1165861 RepID=A0A0L0VNI5_9BASI|nr:hypothetical protein H4Q26_007535 [Puccinia striiformis f. sp. tritici PST-130]KAI9622155.1 hypothetical protein KEM48_007469 [Puccinia striiformis f. sp. tritici PST-130]KAI9627354.1 hypothetical protein H4Q26_017452 [Puccinia striiformis f. sp. tritici PST-130]KNF00565.1 hypothetical protein PSTG_06258 [Puccinia striiformis f. sp. tritici PST-78]